MFWSGVEPGNAPSKRREELKAVGTDKEKTLLAPRSPAMKQLAQECVTRFTAVDLFLCTSNLGVAPDIASLAALPAHTGAGLFYYPSFEAERDGERLGNEVRRVVTRPCGYDAIAKVRTSTGLTVRKKEGRGWEGGGKGKGREKRRQNRYSCIHFQFSF